MDCGLSICHHFFFFEKRERERKFSTTIFYFIAGQNNVSCPCKRRNALMSYFILRCISVLFCPFNV